MGQPASAVTTKWRNTVQYNNEQRACAVCQSVSVAAVTWDNVPLCETHWQEREKMQLGSDQLFRHRTAIDSLERALQEEWLAFATMSGALCA
jgi:hypothetical protein